MTFQINDAVVYPFAGILVLGRVIAIADDGRAVAVPVKPGGAAFVLDDRRGTPMTKIGTFKPVTRRLLWFWKRTVFEFIAQSHAAVNIEST